MRRLIGMVLAAGLLAGCSGTQLLNTVARNSGTVERDLRYSAVERGTYDLYTPQSLASDTPLLIYVHGGSWQFGDRKDYHFLGTAFANRGVQVAVINYPLYPPAVFPEFVGPVAEAVAGLKRDVAGERPVFLAGHSAGAHIAALVALDPSYLAALDTTACATLRGVVGLAGPYDFTPVEPVFKTIFPEAQLPASKPVTHAANPTVPFLVLHGTDDDVVRAERSEQLAAAMTNGGNEATLRLYPEVDHYNIVGSIAPLIRASAPTFEDMLRFINANKTHTSTACGG